jgi:hypothetical protein
VSGALALRTEPVRVKVPAAETCQAARCDVPPAGVVAYLSGDWSQLEVRPVCAGHVLALREMGGCALFPLHAVPTPVFQFMGSTTGTGGMWFGNMQWSA